MVYFDLSPLRAGLSRLPETSAVTSVKQRVDDISGTLPASKRAPAAVGSRAGIAACIEDAGRQRFMNRAATSELEPPEN